MGEGLSHMVKEAQDKYVYIPLLDVLANVLKCPRVYEEVSGAKERLQSCAIKMFLCVDCSRTYKE